MSHSRIKALGIAMVALSLAGCNIGEGPIGAPGTITPPVQIIPQTPMYSGGIYEGVINDISGAGSTCATTNGNFGGLIDEDGNAYLTDSNGCTYFSNNITAGGAQLIPDPDPQNFFPEITGNFDIYTTIGGSIEYAGGIVGGISGLGNYCVSAAITGLNGNAPGTGAEAGTDPISHLWAQAIVSNDDPIDITNDGICGELLSTGNGANQIVGFYSEQAPGLVGNTLYNKDSSLSLLDSRWVDNGNALTITIDANGDIIASQNFCNNISGTFTIDNPDLNVYSAEIDLGTCPRTFSGKGWLSADNATLTLIGTFDIGSVVGAPVYTLQRLVVP